MGGLYPSTLHLGTETCWVQQHLNYRHRIPSSQNYWYFYLKSVPFLWISKCVSKSYVDILEHYSLLRITFTVCDIYFKIHSHVFCYIHPTKTISILFQNDKLPLSTSKCYFIIFPHRVELCYSSELVLRWYFVYFDKIYVYYGKDILSRNIEKMRELNYC